MNSIKKNKNSRWFYYFLINFFKNNGIKPEQFFRGCIISNNGNSIMYGLQNTPMRLWGGIIDWSMTWGYTAEGKQFWSNAYSKFVDEFKEAYRLYSQRF